MHAETCAQSASTLCVCLQRVFRLTTAGYDKLRRNAAAILAEYVTCKDKYGCAAYPSSPNAIARSPAEVNSGDGTLGRDSPDETSGGLGAFAPDSETSRGGSGTFSPPPPVTDAVRTLRVYARLAVDSKAFLSQNADVI